MIKIIPEKIVSTCMTFGTRITIVYNPTTEKNYLETLVNTFINEGCNVNTICDRVCPNSIDYNSFEVIDVYLYLNNEPTIVPVSTSLSTHIFTHAIYEKNTVIDGYLLDGTPLNDNKENIIIGETKQFTDVMYNCFPEFSTYLMMKKVGIIHIFLQPGRFFPDSRYKDLKQTVYSLIYKGAEKIIFFNAYEPVTHAAVYKAQRIVNNFSHILPPEDFIYITGAANGQESYEKWTERGNVEKKMTVLSATAFEEVIRQSPVLEQIRCQTITDDKRDRLFNVDTSRCVKKFLCFNRMPKLHRINFFTEVVKRNLLFQAFYSFHLDTNTLNEFKFLMNNDSKLINSDWNTVFSILNNMATQLPLKLNMNSLEENPVTISEEDIELYFRQTYFSVVTESAYYQSDYEYNGIKTDATDCIFFSEKTFKAIAGKYPFLLLSAPGSLQYLRKIGYKTFSPWINEEYDNEFNDDKRLQMVADETERLCNLPPEELSQIVTEMKDIIDYNFRHLFARKNLDFSDINYKEFFNGRFNGYTKK